jgi:hypothetical protein
MPMRLVRLLGLLGLLALAGCYSMGTVGIIAKSSADPVAFLQKPHVVTDVGPSEGEACRYFALAVVPWGKSDLQAAVDNALQQSGGDALVNVSASSSLYGFVPIYNVFSFTCTTVIGRAVKFDPVPELGTPPPTPATSQATPQPSATPAVTAP